MSAYQTVIQRSGVDSTVYDPETAEERRIRRVRLAGGLLAILLLCALATLTGFWFERLGITGSVPEVVAKGFSFKPPVGQPPSGAKFIPTATYTASAQATSTRINPSATATRLLPTATFTSLPTSTSTLIPSPVAPTASPLPPTDLPSPTSVPPTMVASEAVIPPPVEASPEMQPPAATATAQSLPVEPTGAPVTAVGNPTAESTLPTVDELPTATVETQMASQPPAGGEESSFQVGTTAPTMDPNMIPTVKVMPADATVEPASIPTSAPEAGSQQSAATPTLAATAAVLPQTGGGIQYRFPMLIGLAGILAVIMLAARIIRTARR